MAEGEETIVKVDSSLLKDINNNLKHIEGQLNELVTIGNNIASYLYTLATKR
jgi:hypothetical protein